MIKLLSVDINSSGDDLESYGLKENLFWAIVFALFFVNIPWEIIKGIEFTDIESYVERFNSNIQLGLLIDDGSLISYITSEYLWAALIISLKKIGFPLVFIFKLISFFSILILSFFIYKKSKNFILSSILLLNPLMVDFIMSQLRNSFALSIIILAFLSKNRWVKLILLLSSTMIHSSSVIIIFLILILDNLNYNGKYKNLGILIIIGILIAFTLSLGREYILSLIGDRRAEIQQPESSLLYSIFWIFYISLIIYLKKLSVKDLPIKISFTITLIFFFSVIFGTYASRYLAILLPFLIITIMSLNRANRNFSTGILFFYQIILLTYWAN